MANPRQNNSASDDAGIRTWEDAFLNMFADRGILTSEKSLRLGGLNYFLFTSQFKMDDGRDCSCFGKDEDRVKAAVKCAAESIERDVMSRFFLSAQNKTVASTATLTKSGFVRQDETLISLAPLGLRNSNGWAIHRDRGLAENAAVREAIERHLLLKSFIRFGWKGFNLIQEIQSEDATFYLMTSRYNCAGMISGLVAAKSPLYPGVSLGYCCGKMEDLGQAGFWKTALYEAADKILLLKGREIKLPENSSWMISEIKRLLEEPFDTGVFSVHNDGTSLGDDSLSFFLKSWDIATELKTDLPIFSAFAWGIDLIPLFPTVGLSGEAVTYVQSILSRNGLESRIPPRHPII